MENWQVVVDVPPGEPPPPPPGLPDGDDDLYFDSSAVKVNGYSRDCAGLTSPSGSFNSVHILDGYTGTVSLGAALTVNLFEMTGGAISQPSAGTDLTVLNSFTWTGGTLNSSANAANVNVYGNGTIAPANAGTVTLGSTLNFIGAENDPKETTIRPGTMALTAASGGLVVGAFYTIEARTETQGQIIGWTTQQNIAQIGIQPNGLLRLIGPGTYNNSIRVINTGQFELRGEVQANLSGGNENTSSYLAGGTSQTRIENGSRLTVTHKMILRDQATLFLMMNPNLPANEQTATINGQLNFTGGTILFSAPIGIGTNPLVYGTFTVNGDVLWTGGTYKPSVDYTTAGLANKWIVNGTMNSGAACIIEPNPQRGTTPPASSAWVILDAETTVGDLPTVAAGSPLQLGAFPVGNRIQWKLTSPDNP